MASSPRSVTQLLIDWREGDETALNELIPIVYDELRRMAHRYMRQERPGHTLQTTALINEAYIRLVDHKGIRWKNRAHFYGVAAQAMRRVLVDYARTRGSAKRWGGMRRVDLDEAAAVAKKQAEDLLALDDALTKLASIDPRKSMIVEMKYFGGMTAEEIAEAIGVSVPTINREWNPAKAWLLRELSFQQSLERRADDDRKKE
jgi:RNA polymerase sigma factor (TIGR02999 family)